LVLQAPRFSFLVSGPATADPQIPSHAIGDAAIGCIGSNAVTADCSFAIAIRCITATSSSLSISAASPLHHHHRYLLHHRYRYFIITVIITICFITATSSSLFAASPLLYHYPIALCPATTTAPTAKITSK
jgi:hypothetical protein